MSNEEEIEQQQDLLVTYRRTLAHSLKQQAIQGEAHTPPGVAHTIDEARENIRRIKAILRGWGVDVVNHPDDDPSEAAVPLNLLQQVSRGRLGHIIAGAIGTVIVLALIVAVVITGGQGGSQTQRTPTILPGAAVRPGSSSATATDQPFPTPSAAVTPYPLATPDIPELPDAAPPLTTTIGIARFADCPDISTRLEQELNEGYARLNPPILIKSLAEMQDSEEARAQKESGADLVVWGACHNSSVLTSHFEILSARGAPEVYEPATVTMQETLQEGPAASQAVRLAGALSLYLRRDYPDAAKRFGTAALLETNDEAKAQFYLMQGNSLIFARQDEDAVKAFTLATERRPGWAAAFYNLGVAQTNLGWDEPSTLDTAFSTLTTVLDLDPTFARAAVIQGRIWRRRGGQLDDKQARSTFFNNAEAACSKAAESAESATQALALVCLAYVQISRYAFDKESADLMTVIDTPQFRKLKHDYWSAPLYAEGLAYYWVGEHRKDPELQNRAKITLGNYLSQANDDVHMKPSSDEYAEARVLLEKLNSGHKLILAHGLRTRIQLPPSMLQ